MPDSTRLDIFPQNHHSMKETVITEEPGSQRITLSDVAKAAGVSLATVDRVLNGRAPVSGKRAQQVYDAARALGYHGLPILRARAPAPRQHMRLGIAIRRRHHAFYQQIEADLRAAAARHSTAEVELAFYYHSDNSPAEAVRLAREMGGHCDAIAMMAPDSAELRDTILGLRQRKVFTFSILSDFAVDFRHAYIGVNNRQAGRTAAWGIAHTALRPGRVALVTGAYHFSAQEMRELGFRSYMRERCPHFAIVDTAAVAESSDAVRQAVGQLLDRNDDLVGVYVASGGFEGALEALTARGRERTVSLVVNEITPSSRQALLAGTVSMVIATPVREFTRQLVDEAVSTVQTMGTELSRPEALPFNIVISENTT
ncbi:LacI family DNA-binding transcriptional regulator [Mesorhizobium sp. L-8-10]|uniref:LacI family DNA-binding transcriptional regulator n=1 Tax=Mesorhizobium sp. L-8-10 TaxID=2744523 RepID=UPI001925836D|nr:LacI family DNA-binding transcriptional regulator [Mesorhizobium sp. L-8-10]